jgi:hypothetical protein
MRFTCSALRLKAHVFDVWKESVRVDARTMNVDELVRVAVEPAHGFPRQRHVVHVARPGAELGDPRRTRRLASVLRHDCGGAAVRRRGLLLSVLPARRDEPEHTDYSRACRAGAAPS